MLSQQRLFRRIPMKKYIAVGVLALLLGACNNARDDRMAGGALIGGGAGALAGGLLAGSAGGAIVGGVAGAAVGAVVADATTPYPRRRPHRCYDDMGNMYRCR